MAYPWMQVTDNFCVMAIYFVWLLYADHTALIAINASDLHSLGVFFQYCNKWKLKINANKTKIICFNGNGNYYKKVFTIGNHELDNVRDYKYLGITFTKLNTFNYYFPIETGRWNNTPLQ